MARTATTTTKADPDADRRVSALAEVDTTQPLEHRNGAAPLVKADTNGRNHSDRVYGDLIEIVKHAELQVYEANMGVRLQAELDNALRQMRDRQHVDHAVIAAIIRLGREWGVQVGLNDQHGDGGS